MNDSMIATAVKAPSSTAGLNFTDMERLLKDDDVLLNVVVWADYRLRDDPNAVVLGVDYSGLSYVLEPNGEFSIRSGPVEIVGVWLCIFLLNSLVLFSSG